MDLRRALLCILLLGTAAFAQDLGGGSLCGRLRDGGGNGIPNARVYVQEHSMFGFAMKPSPVVTTGRNGEFSVPKLKGSTYDVYASQSSGPGVLARKIGEVKILAKPLCTFRLFGW
ncbi:MAG TPA: carboxypeptidase-like regulatory domain-containing protein [Terriglobales bacterium]|jgi:hypothetical protein